MRTAMSTEIKRTHLQVMRSVKIPPNEDPIKAEVRVFQFVWTSPGSES